MELDRAGLQETGGNRGRFISTFKEETNETPGEGVKRSIFLKLRRGRTGAVRGVFPSCGRLRGRELSSQSLDWGWLCIGEECIEDATRNTQDSTVSEAIRLAKQDYRPESTE
ncbi:hypothetical protein E2C01_055324 [Portunus trituberculatus]|uniref:Uncharacterized protein n=1 Tax=Portunus trituberculatus TaxID=210409 RepID=A0A5B7GUH9_PORTR|nr:hypothetical protein [Portunus trituberculatus]